MNIFVCYSQAQGPSISFASTAYLCQVFSNLRYRLQVNGPIHNKLFGMLDDMICQ